MSCNPRPRRCLVMAGLWLSVFVLAACGESTPVATPGTPTAPPGMAPDPAGAERPLAEYLHGLSPRQESVTVSSATLEHYRIPTGSGAVLDSWVRRPPGEFGQPLVLVISPYYGGGDPGLSPLGDPSSTFASHLLPYGYAVGMLSVGGTGNSGGCFRDGGPIERQQLYDAVEYLAQQPWSNGAVASIGVSYDGTTANELFVNPPPALKTVVPMDAISDYYRYSFNNGIGRNTLFNTVYYGLVGAAPAGLEGGLAPLDPAGFVTELQGEPCAEQLQIQQESINGELTGTKTPYWDERDAIALVRAAPEIKRPAMLHIEGLQDANVDPQMSDGWLEAVRDSGAPLRVLFGQWVHAYPQAGDCAALAPCRGDFWDQMLLAWFDQWLKGIDTGILDVPAVQLQADDGIWRYEDVWPPLTDTLRLYPQADGSLDTMPGSGTASYLDTGSNHVSEGNTGARIALPDIPGSSVEWVSDPLQAPLRLTGLPTFKALATADRLRGNLVLTLMERRADNTQRYVNFAAINLNHAASLSETDPDISGKPLAVNLNLYPQDNLIAAGSRLVLHVGTDISMAAGKTVPDLSTRLHDYGLALTLIAVGASIELDLAQMELTLPVNRGDRVEPLSWLAPVAAH